RLGAGLGETQDALREALGRLAAAEEVAAQQKRAVGELEQLRAAVAETRAGREAEVAAVTEQRERLAIELMEAHQTLVEARERLAASEVEAEKRARAVAGLEAERGELAARVDETQDALR